MPMTSKEMLKFLKQNGFEEIGQNGSHKKTDMQRNWKNGNRSLSLQRPEKRYGAGNTKTGGAEISPCLRISRRCQYE